ncbi:MAG: DUF4982 domain-containing protein [Rikenellaceae bacterium]|nr:DUF4982 domain-containing protein [Rikenellaceae bacterium]
MSFNRLLRVLSILAILCLFIETSAEAQRVRKSARIDKNWKFHSGDVESGYEVDLNDKNWRVLNVPHDWSIEGEFDRNNSTGRGGGYLPAGVGWYRKSIIIPKSNRNKRVFIEFEGIMANSDVWINGHHLGHRPYGYVGITYDLTDYLTYGPDEPNIIAVRVDNSLQPASRWYTGAGIYRHVKLITVSRTYLDHWGVFVTTPEIIENQATVSVQSEIVNTRNFPVTFQVKTTLTAPDGESFTSVNAEITVGSNSTAIAENIITVNDPLLWDIDDPNLYTAVTQLTLGSRVVDDQSNTFGIRDYYFEPETGFWLNGKNIKLLGVCMHHDGGAVGAAVPASVWERRLNKLKEIGCNAIRVGHSPMDPVFFHVCDRMGFLVMNETFDTWTAAKNHAPYGYNLYFNDWWEVDTRDIIKRDRNHPSIVIYSVGNEIRDNLDSEAGQQRFIDQRDAVKSVDPTRPVTLALFRPNQMNVYTNGFAELMDIVGQNYRVDELIAAWKDQPERKVIGTENSSDRETWLALRDNPFMSGQYIWTGFDYFGEADWPAVASSHGLFDRNGGWKPLSWQRQSWWTDTPMVRIVRREGNDGTGGLTADWTPADMDGYDQAHVVVYSNCEEVELFLNGESLGIVEVNDDASPCEWVCDFGPGEIKAIGRIEGREVAEHSYITAGEASKVSLNAEKSEIKNSWDDVVYITATIEDDNGVRCPNGSEKVKFSISGPGEIVAVDNSNVRNHEKFKGSEITTFKGEAIAIIRATGVGEIKFTASSAGLTGASVIIDAIEN